MNEDCQKVRKEGDELRADENLVCNVCGRYGAYQLSDRNICPECYTGSGSCCPEFGKDDLWEFREEASPKANQPDSKSSESK